LSWRRAGIAAGDVERQAALALHAKRTLEPMKSEVVDDTGR
jgi:hypothetical protein